MSKNSAKIKKEALKFSELLELRLEKVKIKIKTNKNQTRNRTKEGEANYQQLKIEKIK